MLHVFQFPVFNKRCLNWAGINLGFIQVSVDLIIKTFKSFLNVGKFVFKTLGTIIKLFAKNFKTIFGAIGDLIMGIFTFDKEKIKSGFKNLTTGLKNNFTQAFDKIKTDASNLGTNVVDNFNESVKSKEIAPIKIPTEVVTSTTTSGGGGGGGGGTMPTATTSGAQMVGVQDVAGPITASILADTEGIPDAMDQQQEVLNQKRLEALQNAMDFNAGLNQIVTGGLNDLAVGIGQALGQALSEGGNLTQQLSKIVLTTVGNMAVQLGKLAISIGIGVAAIKKALQSLNPAVAIAAGIALVALGSFASAQAGKIGSGGGGATAFANGGIVSGPTMGLVGEYPGARSNPEVIAPLNKLQNIIGNTGGSQNITVGGQIRLDGQDLLIAIERANETAERIF